MNWNFDELILFLCLQKNKLSNFVNESHYGAMEDNDKKEKDLQRDNGRT